ncbi:MAG: acyl-CoA dehydrogenase family protein, partial [Betaproteobacteria bacterium]
MLEVEYDDQQRAFSDAVRLLCDRVRPEWTEQRFPERTWAELAAIGLFELVEPSGTAELAAVLTELGAQGCPGPLWDAVLAIGALPPESTRSLVDGSQVAVVGTGDRWPWPDRAGLAVELGPDGAWLARLPPHTPRRRVLTGEQWAAGQATRLDPIAQHRLTDALDRADLAAAAYLTGAAERLVADAARYVAARQQFGQPLGDRQGVAFPLAEA